MIPHWAGHPEGEGGLGAAGWTCPEECILTLKGRLKTMGTENSHQCTGPQS